MDTGLLLTVVIVLGGVQLALRVLPPTAADRVQVVELLSTPLIAGLIAARLVFVLLDHPASVFQLRDLMVVRAGMEFWAGVVVALLLVLCRIRRSNERGGAARTFAVATPFLLLGVALYEPQSTAGVSVRLMGDRSGVVICALGVLWLVGACWVRSDVWWACFRRPGSLVNGPVVAVRS